jgi:hypothetical protein
MVMPTKGSEKFAAETNPYLYTTIVTIFVAISWGVVRYFIGWGFDLVNVLVFGIVFWIGFFLWTSFLLKRKRRA